MNNKVLILTAALMLPPAAAIAVVPGEGGYTGLHSHNLDHLSKELSLSAEQKSKLEEIFKEQHEKFRAIHEESHNLIKKVLSADQIEKWEKIVSRYKEKRYQKTDDSQNQNP